MHRNYNSNNMKQLIGFDGLCLFSINICVVSFTFLSYNIIYAPNSIIIDNFFFYDILISVDGFYLNHTSATVTFRTRPYIAIYFTAVVTASDYLKS